MYFNINNYVELINGKNKFLIINKKKCMIIEITKKCYSILKRCQKGIEINKITNNNEFLNKILNKLQKLNVGKLEKEKKTTKFKKLNKNELEMIWLPLTSVCNYKCIHCYEMANNTKKIEKEISIEDYKYFFDSISKNYSLKCVQLTGGEPLLRGKIFVENLLKLLAKYNIETIEIFSNLSLMDNDYIEMFKKYNVSVATSLYSQNSETNDFITQTKGSLENTIKKLKNLKENNIKFRVGIIIMEQNKDEKDSLRTWINNLFELNDLKKFDIIRPIGRGENNINIPKEIFKEQYIDQIKHVNFLNFLNYDYNKKYNSCWGNKICLKSNGKLYPCVMSKVQVGNYKNILKILNKKNSYRFLTKDKIKVCKFCEYRYLCNECRAMYSKNKRDLKCKPFTCTYNPLTNKFGGKYEN